jgi:hypothetical protein
MMLAGPARSIDRYARNGVWPACRQRCEPSDVAGLIADLGHAPPNNVIDGAGVDAGPLDEGIQNRG